MATQLAAKVAIKNNSGGNASILLFHNNTSTGTQRGMWQAEPGQTVGPLTVLFETGWTVFDYWSVLIHVQDGPAAGYYVSSSTTFDQYGVEYQLQNSDAGKTFTFSVSPTTFDLVFASGSRSDGMTKIAPASPITHVFVVMLENHSFDNMFAMSGIQGITAATTSNCNPYTKNKITTNYCVQTSAPLSMPTDPGHEFQDVAEQLAGQGKSYPNGGPYPTIDNSGFAANYATSDSEDTGLPTDDEIVDIMACFATPIQLKTIYQLATQFAVCDQWYSSLPGPTWPNRFFVHGASSSGLDHSPSNCQMEQWETGTGFQYPKGSIYQALKNAGIPYQFYHDSTGFPSFASIYSDNPQNGSAAGAVPQVASLDGLPNMSEMELLGTFATDLQGPYPYPYTFIEPHYGDVVSGKYIGGSSQHPMDDVYGGENLLANVYAAIRKSPYWNTSLLIITYDEHGGLYDSVNPGMHEATPPGDNPNYGYSQYGFKFDVYGVRVPAVIASPLIPKGTVDHTVYDHSSVPKTLEHLFNLQPLTNRDKAANHVMSLLCLDTPRTDCPISLDTPAPLLKSARPLLTAEERAVIDAQPLPQSGNLKGALLNLRKAEIELSAGTPAEIAAINARFHAITTRGDARAYAQSVMEKVALAREQRLSQRRKR